MPVVRTDGLRKTYRPLRGESVDALRALDLTVDRGEIFGLLGPNGAGKTTLVKLLLGVVHPSGGGAWLLDSPIGDHRARQRVGFLPENHRFPPYLTANQILNVYGRLGGVDTRDRRSRSEELLAMVRLTKWADVPVRKYSKGMMQRLSLAQALLNQPELLFLDEPTDGVDPVGRREIRDILIDLRDEGTTVFLNSHLLGEVEQVCSRVAILNEGELVHQGSVDVLTRSERVWELRCTELPADLEAELRQRLSPIDAAAGAHDTSILSYHLIAEDRAQLNRSLDALRSGGVEIESLSPLRQSLEDAFVEVVTRESRGESL